MYQRLCVIERRREGERESAGTHLVVDEGREGQEVEQVGEVLPDVGVAVLAQALVVEAVHLGDLARLVVAAQDRDAVAVPHLERDEERHRLDRVVAAVDVVAHEEVVGVGRVATDAEQLGQVVLCACKSGEGRSVRARRSAEDEERDGRRTNWPWMSPQTVTGHLTGWTLLSSTRTSRACETSEGGRGQPRGPSAARRAAEESGAHLVAQALDVVLGELLAVGEVGDPCWRRRWGREEEREGVSSGLEWLGAVLAKAASAAEGPSLGALARAAAGGRAKGRAECGLNKWRRRRSCSCAARREGLALGSTVSWQHSLAGGRRGEPSRGVWASEGECSWW